MLGVLKRKSVIRVTVVALLLTMVAWMVPANVREVDAATTLQNPRAAADGTVTWDCVYFGHYPQSSDGKGGFNNDPIKWRVLSVDGNEMLLLADKNLDCKRYNEECTDATWETSTIRNWLNNSDSDDFLGKAFSSTEQKAIYEKNIQNPDNPEYNIAGGSVTKDKVFLLSIDEVENPMYGFLKTHNDIETRKAVNTDYTNSHGAWSDKIFGYAGHGDWWLRSPGVTSHCAACIGYTGVVSCDGLVGDSKICVRPALRLNLSSNLWSYAGTVSSDGKVDETEGGKDTTVIPGKIEYATGSYSADDREDTNENRIREAARDFQVKANQYMKEIQAAIKDENRNIDRTEKVAKLQEEDESNKAGKMLSMQETISGPAKEAAYAGVGEFISQYEGSSEALGKIDYSKDIISIAAKIENDIKKATKPVNIITTYKGYNVYINGTFEKGAFSCGVKVDRKGEHYTGILNSTPKQAANAMAAYLKELNDIVEDVVKQAMAKAVRDFCKRTCITDITEEMLAEHVIEYMNKTGYGKNILDYVMKLQKGYELAAELSQLGKVDLNSPDAINKIYDSLKKLSLSDKTVTVEKFAVKEAVKAVEESRERLANMLYNYVYHPDQELDTKRGFLEKAKDWFYKGYKKITGQCPVEFRVYDKAGKQLGYAKDSYCEFDDSIHMEVLGDIKTIYIPDDLDVTIEMEGTDAGSMTYTVEQYKERKAVGRLNYYNVPLTEGSSYSQSLTTGSLSTETTDYPLKSETGATVDADEYLPAEKDATVKIETSIEGNGTVEGTGTYAKGDCVILIASAGKGYHLEGWYQNDKLVETNSVYHLPALKSDTVKAVFTKNTEDKPSDPTTKPPTTPTSLRKPRVNGETVTWDCVWFGHYPQSKNRNGGYNSDPIKWRVLSVNGNEALLLADKNLDCQKYNEKDTSVTWETSTIRSWLNGSNSDSFLGKAFTGAEQGAIYNKTIQNESNPKYGTAGGNTTRDKVFLLSIGEAINPAYGFPKDYNDDSKTRRAVNTAYTASRGMYSEGNTDYWWLRSPGYNGIIAAVVSGDGSVYRDGNYIDFYLAAVRPALRLNLSSNLWSYAGTVSAIYKEIKPGSVIQDRKSNASYIVTGTGRGANKNTVTYKKPQDNKKTNIVIPATVKIVGKNYRVTKIASNAFKNNSKIKTVKIGANIQSIGTNAFNKCTKLTSIVIPSKVKTIQKGAFANCKNLKNITIKTTKLTKKSIGKSAFKGTVAKAKVKTPKGKAKTYKKLLQSKGLSKKATVK